MTKPDNPLSRWSKRKNSARNQELQSQIDQAPAESLSSAMQQHLESDSPEGSDPGNNALSIAESDGTAQQDSASETDVENPVEPVLSDEDMPPLASITRDTDMSCFFNAGVSNVLRQKALKHLFGLPAFNIRDGLNDYDEDYTYFEPLGDTVTADMKFHEARKAKLEEERLAKLQEEEQTLNNDESAEQSDEKEITENDTTDDATEEDVVASDSESEPIKSEQTTLSDHMEDTSPEEALMPSSEQDAIPAKAESPIRIRDNVQSKNNESETT